MLHNVHVSCVVVSCPTNPESGEAVIWMTDRVVDFTLAKVVSHLQSIYEHGYWGSHELYMY